MYWTRLLICLVVNVILLARPAWSLESTKTTPSDDTVFQASTTTALVEGIYRGAIDVGTVLRHGDFGLGTFENLDGEMIVLDGVCYQALSDGNVHPVSDEVLVPYAVVSKFGATKTVDLNCNSVEELQSECDKLRNSNNIFFAVKASGLFDFVHVRIVRKTKEGTPLVEATAVQSEFKLDKIRGTVVGFWSPQYVKTLSVPGYHLHFLSDDRKIGGHLLDCRGIGIKLEIDPETNLSVALPTNEEFLRADLTRDPSADLRRAESKADN